MNLKLRNMKRGGISQDALCQASLSSRKYARDCAAPISQEANKIHTASRKEWFADLAKTKKQKHQQSQHIPCHNTGEPKGMPVQEARFIYPKYLAVSQKPFWLQTENMRRLWHVSR